MPGESFGSDPRDRRLSPLPDIAGRRQHRGPWRGGRRAPYGSRLAAGQQVLPCAGAAPGSGSSIDETLVVPVPPAVDDLLAARGYISISADGDVMFKRWPVAGNTSCWTAALASCASLLGSGRTAANDARSVSGIIRSPQHRARQRNRPGSADPRYRPGADGKKVSQHSDLVFDAVGSELANTLLVLLGC